MDAKFLRTLCAIRARSLVLTIAASALLTSAGSLQPAGAAERLTEGIAAQVGSDIVLISEVMELAGPVEERLRQAGAPEQEIAMVRRDALERLIESRLLTSVVDRLELGAEREEIDSAIEAIAQDNGLTIEQLLSSVTGHGLSVEEYRDKIRGEIERSKVINAMVRSQVQIEEEEVRALYDEQLGDQREGGEEVFLRLIVVRSEGSHAESLSEACALVAQTRRQISRNELEFSEAARDISEANAETGGELGWMHGADLAGWMSERVRDMQPGELSPVIEMPFGCNLLQLVDRREYRPVTFEEAESQLRNMLFQKKTEEEYVKWLDVLRGQVYIERKGTFGG